MRSFIVALGAQDWRHQLDDTITDRLREDAEHKRMEDKLKKDRIADASAQLSYVNVKILS